MSAVAFLCAVIGVPVESVVGEVHDDVLDLRILLIGDETVLAAEAAHLEAAPGRAGIDAMMIVDPGDAALQPMRDAMGAREIAGPDRGRQAERGAVGQRN